MKKILNRDGKAQGRLLTIYRTWGNFFSRCLFLWYCSLSLNAINWILTLFKITGPWTKFWWRSWNSVYSNWRPTVKFSNNNILTWWRWPSAYCFSSTLFNYWSSRFSDTGWCTIKCDFKVTFPFTIFVSVFAMSRLLHNSHVVIACAGWWQSIAVYFTICVSLFTQLMQNSDIIWSLLERVGDKIVTYSYSSWFNSFTLRHCHTM